MAEKFNVTGEQDLNIDKQMFEIKRQIRQKGGSPIDPKLVALALQDVVMGKFHSEIMKDKVVSQPNFSFLEIKQTGIVIPCLTEQFIPNDIFRNNSKVKYYLGDNYKKYLVDKTQPFNTLPEAIVDKSVLKKQTTDKDIMTAIGVSETENLLSEEEILYRTSYLTEQQPNGEKGLLLTDGSWTIIGYFLCSDGVVRVAGVLWHGDSWCCSVYDLGRWRKGFEVLSRNGILKP